MEMETSRKKKEKGNGESGTKGMQKDSPYDLMDISWNLADDTLLLSLPLLIVMVCFPKFSEDNLDEFSNGISESNKLHQFSVRLRSALCVGHSRISISQSLSPYLSAVIIPYMGAKFPTL
ncbi:hypothetical protein HZH66_014300 [Vespula vulgaris]|uniref:Uncharacterized protein n=1 Tax=Vespula vulgaris TaxID=7454 RepID=A0A834J5R4_VESVU|nr:hypothetical protein HZH66_014300 [Vespula vulgaris]